jgi:thiamine-monophosphate kinase
MVRRHGAKPGDHVFVTGTIGDAALGLHVRRDAKTTGKTADKWGLDGAMRDHLVSRFRLPQPRNALAEAVRAHASAAMDVSDGLVADLTKLCRVSGVSADIDAARVPLSPAAAHALKTDPTLIDPILSGGEDYEILCAVAPGSVAGFQGDAAKAGVPVTEIGRITEGEAAPRFLDRAGRLLAFARPGHSHF